jgi:hypothetical protein
MPIHDWTLVEAGLFHHFHQRWIGSLSDALNTGALPPGFFALAEQSIKGPVPDVLTLKVSPEPEGIEDEAGGVAVATAPPLTKFIHQAEPDLYAHKANRITVRHKHRRGQIIAVVEIVSPGNKNSTNALHSFVEESVELLRQGIHLLIVDLFPPSKRDPAGIHKAIWDEINDEPFSLPAKKPLTLAAYSAGYPTTAYIEPVGVGDSLPDMALFLTPDHYVPTPLEETYRAAWAVFPKALKPELEPRRRNGKRKHAK